MVTIISHKVVCMICLSALLSDAKVFVRGEVGDERVMLNSDRELVFGHVETPQAVVRPPDRFVPNAGPVATSSKLDGRTRLGKEMKAAQLAGV